MSPKHLFVVYKLVCIVFAIPIAFSVLFTACQMFILLPTFVLVDIFGWVGFFYAILICVPFLLIVILESYFSSCIQDMSRQIDTMSLVLGSSLFQAFILSFF